MFKIAQKLVAVYTSYQQTLVLEQNYIYKFKNISAFSFYKDSFFPAYKTTVEQSRQRHCWSTISGLLQEPFAIVQLCGLHVGVISHYQGSLPTIILKQNQKIHLGAALSPLYSYLPPPRWHTILDRGLRSLIAFSYTMYLIQTDTYFQSFVGSKTDMRRHWRRWSACREQHNSSSVESWQFRTRTTGHPVYRPEDLQSRHCMSSSHP